MVAELLDSDKVHQLCVSESEAVALGQLGVLLEQMFGGPRDIEWAIAEVSTSNEMFLSLIHIGEGIFSQGMGLVPTQHHEKFG